jgi:Fe-S-cluster containining protein
MTHQGPIRSLSIHADYRCKHCGTCCSGALGVPIDEPFRKWLDEAIGSGGVELPESARRAVQPLLVPDDFFTDRMPTMPGGDDGACIFYEGESARLCTLHRQAGAESLPAACRHFPRVCLLDGRGVSITLSHYYCPTAAATLFRDDTPLAIVDYPSAFPLDGDYEGLDARDELPPLLRPELLCDLEGYQVWESLIVETCAREDLAPGEVLRILAWSADEMRAWRPGSVSLPVHAREVAVATKEMQGRGVRGLGDLPRAAALHEEITASIPKGLFTPEPIENFYEMDRLWVRNAWDGYGKPVRRYLAARGFASWFAYQGRGLRTVVAGMGVALAAVRVETVRQCTRTKRPLDDELMLEAFRAADLLMLHLASRKELARRLSAVETLAPGQFVDSLPS